MQVFRTRTNEQMCAYRRQGRSSLETARLRCLHHITPHPTNLIFNMANPGGSSYSFSLTTFSPSGALLFRLQSNPTRLRGHIEVHVADSDIGCCLQASLGRLSMLLLRVQLVGLPTYQRRCPSDCACAIDQAPRHWVSRVSSCTLTVHAPCTLTSSLLLQLPMASSLLPRRNRLPH